MGRTVAARARRQGGAISVEQLRALGVDHDQLHRLTTSGWLIRVHRGVYRFGALDREGLLFAAALAMGPDAAVSHLSATHVHGLLRTNRPAPVDVTAPTTRRPRDGISPHRAKLHPYDVTTRRGLRLTTVSRTLLDIAADVREPLLQAAVDEARVLRRLHRRSIEETIARATGHHGIGALRRAVARHDRGRGIPIGALERRAIAFLREYDFPPYLRNYAVEAGGERFTLDVVWPEQRVALEFDGRTYHDTDPAFAADRRRSRRLAAIGWHVVRGTWVDLDERPAELAADVWALLL